MEADSRVSPVSALKANPRTVIRYNNEISITQRTYVVGRRELTLFVMVLNIVSTTFFANLFF